MAGVASAVASPPWDEGGSMHLAPTRAVVVPWQESFGRGSVRGCVHELDRATSSLTKGRRHAPRFGPLVRAAVRTAVAPVRKD